ncbi:MAG: tRNA (adenosine(37)-N6)-threonylcarbamoyltransferase complex dimerization subunit type 1 TsaB [Bacteroidales bacterium]
MALILNLETATETCSVALARNGVTLLLKESAAGRNHASDLTLFISQILDETALGVSDLDGVAVSMGPGSYTGLRIGVSVAKGLCYGANIPLLAISTLQAMVSGLPTSDRADVDFFVPMLDARRMEVYTALFDASATALEPVSARIITQDSFKEWLEKGVVSFFGDGSSKCREYITHPNARFVDNFRNSARYMALLSEAAFARNEFRDIAYFEPFYLKDFIATVPKNKVLGQLSPS